MIAFFVFGTATRLPPLPNKPMALAPRPARGRRFDTWALPASLDCEVRAAYRNRMLAEPLADLTDAVARGRLTAAEIAAISPAELEAMFELGALRLDTGRDHEAVAIFAGLVSLFPYIAKYWRAYGIAMHRTGEYSRARAAYDAALLLEPDHKETLCYRGEVCLYQGDLSGAVSDLGQVVTGAGDLVQRAAALLKCVEGIAPIADRLAPASPPVSQPDTEPDTFTLADGRPLPLAGSKLFVAETESEPTPISEAPEPLAPEETKTAQTYVPEVADLWEPEANAVTPPTQARPPSYGEAETTATQPLRHITRGQRALRQVTEPLHPVLAPASGAGRAAVTETALIPGRPRALAPEREARQRQAERLPPPPVATAAEEVTHTAIVRRRVGEPLNVSEEDTLTNPFDPLATSDDSKV